jgi:hypothetical protein
MIRCENGNLNGHNSAITLCLACNTDLKPIASGTVEMAMVEYMLNYTVKLQLDTSIVFSTLCASIKALTDNPPKDIDGNTDSSEMSRLLLVKTTNSLVGKRELSGQQTANFLLGRKNHHVSDVYCEYWWSSLLRDIARDIFANLDSSMVTEEIADELDPDRAQRLIIPEYEDDSLIVLFPDTLQQTRTEEIPVKAPEKRFSKISTIYSIGHLNLIQCAPGRS